jgi:hypothetical protein
VTDIERWQKNNQAYLTAALEWLRLRLTRLAMPPKTTVRASAKTASKSLVRKTKSDEAVEKIAKAAKKMTTAATKTPQPALPLLGRLLGLQPFEEEILLLCAAMELDTRMPALCAKAQDNPEQAYPTFALAMALFDDPVWEVLSPERPLRYWRLIDIIRNGVQPMTAGALRIDERIVAYIKGLNFVDERIAAFLVPFQPSEIQTVLPPSQQAAVDRALRYLRQIGDHASQAVVQLVGPDTFSKHVVAQQITAAGGHHLYRLPAELLPMQPEALDQLSRLWQRESLLLPLALYIDTQGDDHRSVADGQAPPLQRFLARSRGIFFVGSRDIQRDTGGSAGMILEIDKPTPFEQQQAWQEVLGEAGGESPALLAAQFNLNTATIRQVVRRAVDQAAAGKGDLHTHLWKTCLNVTRPRMDQLAQRLEPMATWNDIVLSAETEALLRRIVSQVRRRSRVYDQWGFRNRMNRGLGISVLFAGESGTGKTMAAEVIANDLALNLYRIDLSQVVSKYIGETEKNLGQLFDAAEDGGAILFFDEADALFGKRSEVKDSHDRYANIEINYLLQRLESYRGLSILATNMKSALDRAFLRRLRFIVNFAFPEALQRQAIWEKIFPPETDLDPPVKANSAFLAKLNITGGSIHNIALSAAFMAAEAGSAVTMPLILDAARLDFRKMERPIREIDFAWKQPGGSG